MTSFIVSYGAGSNSTAMTIEWVRLRLPLAAIVFADTGGERPETYSFVSLFSSWLVERGYPAITVIRNDGKHGTLERECLSQHNIPAVAYGGSSCSDKYKMRPFRKWLKGSGLHDVTVLLGFDSGEPGRKKRALTYTKGYNKIFPLIEWGWGRDKCIEAIDRAGLPRPGKSSCFFCPNSKPNEIISLYEKHPLLMERAIALEDGANLKSIKGLGRAWSWKDFICADDAQQKMFGSVCMGQPCGCYDG